MREIIQEFMNMIFAPGTKETYTNKEMALFTVFVAFLIAIVVRYS
jgi:hypothetical protein